MAPQDNASQLSHFRLPLFHVHTMHIIWHQKVSASGCSRIFFSPDTPVLCCTPLLVGSVFGFKGIYGVFSLFDLRAMENTHPQQYIILHPFASRGGKSRLQFTTVVAHKDHTSKLQLSSANGCMVLAPGTLHSYTVVSVSINRVLEVHTLR